MTYVEIIFGHTAMTTENNVNIYTYLSLLLSVPSCNDIIPVTKNSILKVIKFVHNFNVYDNYL